MYGVICRFYKSLLIIIFLEWSNDSNIYVGDVGTSGLSLGRSPILGLEVTELVAERSHGHGMNEMSYKEGTDVEGHAV